MYICPCHSHFVTAYPSPSPYPQVQSLVGLCLYSWVICSEVDGVRVCHTEWSKSEGEKQIQYANTYIWNLREKKKKGHEEPSGKTWLALWFIQISAQRHPQRGQKILSKIHLLIFIPFCGFIFTVVTVVFTVVFIIRAYINMENFFDYGLSSINRMSTKLFALSLLLFCPPLIAQ